MIGGSIDLDTQLHDVITGEPTVKALIKDRKILKERLNQRIHIQRLDDEGQEVASWHILRRKCTPDFLQSAIDNCPLPCEIDYLYDNAGNSLLLNEFLLKAEKEPDVFYVVVPRVDRRPRDDLEEMRYYGQTMFMLQDTPHKAVNGVIVEAISIRTYLLAAIVEIDPLSEKIKADIASIQEEKSAMEKKIRNVPNYVPRDNKGQPLPDAAANTERQHMLNVYNDDKIKIQNKLKDREQDLEMQIRVRQLMPIELFRADIDEFRGTALWHIRFMSDDAAEIEFRLAEKADWHEIKLAVGEQSDEIPPWAGRGRMPDGSGVEEYNYMASEVAIHESRIARLAHGIGTYKELNNTRTSIKGDKFRFYYGDWDCGRRNGFGISIDDVGVFRGRHVDDRRRGQGTLDIATGSTLSGVFDVSLQHESHVEGDFENPYLEGEPKGAMEVAFSDGAIFKGNFADGRINGKGEYQSAFGEIMKGTFVDGVLDGTDCYLKNYNQEQFRGRFAEGEMDGYGHYTNKYGRSHLGYWRYGLRHGRGVESGRGKYVFKGYFINDYRCGKGELQYDKRDSTSESYVDGSEVLTSDLTSDPATAKSPAANKSKVSNTASSGPPLPVIAPDPLRNFKRVYQGFFLANRTTQGGAIVDSEKRTISSASRYSKLLDPLAEANRRLDKRRIRAKRRNSKFTELEMYIRNELEQKKWKIFRQQRHYTKNAMSFEEKFGLDEKEVQSLLGLRQDRLDQINVDSYKSTKAVVDTLRRASTTPSFDLQDAFDRLQSDPSGKDPDLDIMARVAVSNFDEYLERKRFINYDKLWERAEAAYASRKKT